MQKHIVYPIDISRASAYAHFMNAPSNFGRKASLFKSNRNQAVRIPKDMEFPADVKEVHILKIGKRLEIIPVGALWDEFFSRVLADDDFVAPEDRPPHDREFGFD
jgi:antitoxin VapB